AGFTTLQKVRFSAPSQKLGVFFARVPPGTSRGRARSMCPPLSDRVRRRLCKRPQLHDVRGSIDTPIPRERTRQLLGMISSMKIQSLLSLVAAASLAAGCATSSGPSDEPAARSTAPALQSGVLLANIDKAVRPQDDFYRFVNGNWLAVTEI